MFNITVNETGSNLVLKFTENGLSKLKELGLSVKSVTSNILTYYSVYREDFPMGCRWIGERGDFDGNDIAEVKSELIDYLVDVEFE
jgi:hypothetical protein